MGEATINHHLVTWANSLILHHRSVEPRKIITGGFGEDGHIGGIAFETPGIHSQRQIRTDKNNNKTPTTNKYNKTRFEGIIMKLRLQVGKNKITDRYKICTSWYHWVYRKKQREVMGCVTDPRTKGLQDS